MGVLARVMKTEDGDDLESESIANQRDYLLKFLRDNKIRFGELRAIN